MLVLSEIQLVPGTRTSDFFTPVVRNILSNRLALNFLLVPRTLGENLCLPCLKFYLSRAPGQVIFLPLVWICMHCILKYDLLAWHMNLLIINWNVAIDFDIIWLTFHGFVQYGFSVKWLNCRCRAIWIGIQNVDLVLFVRVTQVCIDMLYTSWNMLFDHIHSIYRRFHNVRFNFTTDKVFIISTCNLYTLGDIMNMFFMLHKSVFCLICFFLHTRIKVHVWTCSYFYSFLNVAMISWPFVIVIETFLMAEIFNLPHLLQIFLHVIGRHDLKNANIRLYKDLIFTVM